MRINARKVEAMLARDCVTRTGIKAQRNLSPECELHFAARNV